jgi:hypothetical protein
MYEVAESGMEGMGAMYLSSDRRKASMYLKVDVSRKAGESRGVEMIDILKRGNRKTSAMRGMNKVFISLSTALYALLRRSQGRQSMFCLPNMKNT